MELGNLFVIQQKIKNIEYLSIRLKQPAYVDNPFACLYFVYRCFDNEIQIAPIYCIAFGGDWFWVIFGYAAA
jgi:hypothetical protein